MNILLVSACSVNNSSIKNTVVLQASKYQLENGNTFELKLNYSVVKSLKPIYATNELMVDPGAGTEFLDNAGKYKSVYNQKLASITPKGRYAFAFGGLWDLATNQQLKFYQSD